MRYQSETEKLGLISSEGILELNGPLAVTRLRVVTRYHLSGVIMITVEISELRIKRKFDACSGMNRNQGHRLEIPCSGSQCSI